VRGPAPRPKPVRVAAALLAALLLFACEAAPEIQHPLTYSRDGISFRHPGNWSVTEDVANPGDPRFRYLFVESPGSAIVIVHHYEPRLELSVQEFAARFARSEVEEAEDLVRLGPSGLISARTGDSGPVRSVVAGTSRERVEQSFSVSAAGAEVPHRFRAFRVETDSGSAFLIAQAAVEDWDLVAPGFDLVLASFEVE
jgi:hypothetical protein